MIPPLIEQNTILKPIMARHQWWGKVFSARLNAHIPLFSDRRIRAKASWPRFDQTNEDWNSAFEMKEPWNLGFHHGTATALKLHKTLFLVTLSMMGKNLRYSIGHPIHINPSKKSFQHFCEPMRLGLEWFLELVNELGRKRWINAYTPLWLSGSFMFPNRGSREPPPSVRKNMHAARK